jgi:hypothetical protein
VFLGLNSIRVRDARRLCRQPMLLAPELLGGRWIIMIFLLQLLRQLCEWNLCNAGGVSDYDSIRFNPRDFSIFEFLAVDCDDGFGVRSRNKEQQC